MTAIGNGCICAIGTQCNEIILPGEIKESYAWGHISWILSERDFIGCFSCLKCGATMPI